MVSLLLRLFLLSEMQFATPPDIRRYDLSTLASLFCPYLLLRYGLFAASVRPVQLQASVDSAEALRVELDKKVSVHKQRVFLAGVGVAAEHTRKRTRRCSLSHAPRVGCCGTTAVAAKGCEPFLSGRCRRWWWRMIKYGLHDEPSPCMILNHAQKAPINRVCRHNASRVDEERKC